MNKLNGFLYGLLSSASFGLIPLFTIPAMREGMNFESILFYRFLFACLALGCILLLDKQSFHIKRKEIPSLMLLAFLYLMSAVFLFWGYKFMASGVATTIHFMYPVLTTLIMMIFFWLWLGHTSLINPNHLPFFAVVLGLTLYNGSVIAELVRSGVHQLPKGQSEAGLSLGLSSGQVLRMIQLPQALVAMMPALLSQFVVILKDTALGYIITYGELLDAAKRLGAAHSMLQALIVAALLFIVINALLTTLAQWLSRYLSHRVGVRAKV